MATGAIVIRFPDRRNRARRNVFEATEELERTQRTLARFFVACAIATVAVMTTLQVLWG